MAETKTAAYICKGCEIDKRVDVAALSKVATKSGKMNIVREHDFLCSAEGVAMIRTTSTTKASPTPPCAPARAGPRPRRSTSPPSP
jgi:quinone-modifying oxidoreductase subunit QmoB